MQVAMKGLGRDLVATLDAGPLQCHGVVDGGNAAARAGEGGDLLFELGDLDAYEGDEVGVDAVDQVLLFLSF
ncbi:hypothetical protein WCE34_09095 [Luteimonas sp. MJ204]|uniref:hypothetical protein n=1 Tax=Luteimonas sp. MJ145 TaxID=3129234 RepID=UPI0031BB5465